MGEIFEAIMVICFGLSWPLSVYKSWKAKTVKGKSLLFECFILLGYVCGIVGKILTGKITYVFVFYILNLIMVSTDLCLYYRNWRLDQAKEL
jgi:formate hydrogenlyase subunit 3/multisubunit Na+/H+ antiporter MnhD subunit